MKMLEFLEVEKGLGRGDEIALDWVTAHGYVHEITFYYNLGCFYQAITLLRLVNLPI